MTQAPAFSYEFFPPRSVAMQRRFWRALGQLERLKPEFFSMTYGALGSAKQVSVDTALAMQDETPIPVAAHLTCADSSAEQTEALAREFNQAGLKRIVALRGDAADAQHNYAYSSTVDFICSLKAISDFDISVAAYPEVHPQAVSAEQDLQHLKAKLDAGANRAITQFFFDADTFLRFRDRAVAIGIDKPIVPGILPIHDFDKVQNFAERCGAQLPTTFETAYNQCKGDEQATYDLSCELAVALCETLIREGVEQLHLYTLNLTDMCLDVSLALGAEVSTRKTPHAA